MTARVLVVEDEPTIRRAVGYALRRDGFEVAEAADGGEALATAEEGFDVVILDLGLPTVSGTEVLRRLRAAGPVPIIVLTALGTESDRVLGLELGADDYVTKPFSMAELMSRVRAILRRCELDSTRRDPVRVVGGLRIDLGRHQVDVDGHSVYLTASQFKVLALLAEEPGDVVSRQAIMQRLWDSDYVGDELSAQNITFPDAEGLTAEGRTDLMEFAGNKLNTGDEAEAYASYIGGHLEEIADGATFADLGTPERAAKGEVKAAIEAGQPQAQVDELQAKADVISGQRNSLFKGETLRGLLLSTYAWSTVGMIAGIAAIGAFIASGLMMVLVGLGLVHHRRTPKTA